MSAGLDCWGLVRIVLRDEFNGPELELFSGVVKEDGADMDSGYQALLTDFVECRPVEGALACCFQVVEGREVFHHVGICVSDSEIMHTTEARGVHSLPIRVFRRVSAKVRYYRYAK